MRRTHPDPLLQRALKKMKESATFQKVREMRELRSLLKLPPHLNIVKLYEVLVEDNIAWFAFEYMADGSLTDLLSHRKQNDMPPLPSYAIRGILEQILLGIHHMHENRIFHRDLKPENILFSGTRASVADFSMARGLDEGNNAVTSYVSTRWYRAPEIILISKQYSAPVDMFAFGCIGAELFSQTPLFPGSDEMDQLRRIFAVVGTPAFSRWDEGSRLLQEHYRVVDWRSRTPPTLRLPCVQDATAHHFLMALLRLDPNRRLNSIQALNHDYFELSRDPQRLELDIPTAVTPSSTVRSDH